MLKKPASIFSIAQFEDLSDNPPSRVGPALSTHLISTIQH